MTTIKSILQDLNQGKYLGKGGVDGALRDIEELIDEAKPQITFNKPEGMPNTLAVDFAERHIATYHNNLKKVLDICTKE